MKTDTARSSFAPKRKNVIVRQLSDEFLLYDEATNKAHCLNESAADIWHLCDGKRTVADIARVLEKESKSRVDEQMLWVALMKFENAGLLQNDIPRSHTGRRLSRREAVRKVGAAATALAVPVITSVLAPKAEAAVSCSTLGGPCNPRPCCAGMLLTCVAHTCV
jgi:hypothetical protein